MSRSVDIVIVNWNSGEQLSRCIASIERFGADIVSKVVVVDNGSTDGSADELGSPGFSLTVLKNETNNGFGRACNEGAAVCDAEYLLFLNPDTELFARSLAAPLKVLDETKNDGVGICGVQLVDESGEACVSYWRFPKMSDFIFKQLGLEALFDGRKMDYGLLQGRTDALRVDQVIGAFFIIRMSVYAELGGFDERFFVYYEEVDLSLRAYQAGWRSACATSATCLHIGGGLFKSGKGCEALLFSSQ
jgi:GT2 family glycosyltransferase